MLQRCVRRSRNGEDIRQRMDTDIAEVTRKIGEAETASRSWLRKKNEDQTLAIAQVSQKVDRVSSEIPQTVSQAVRKCRQIAQVRQYVDKKGEITSTTDKNWVTKAVTIQQIQRVQSDTRNELNAMYIY